jgi:hypothetical protein
MRSFFNAVLVNASTVTGTKQANKKAHEKSHRQYRQLFDGTAAQD